MLITGVSVEGVGMFDRMASIRGLGAGVNVLAAGNEAGKSTLFRAIRTCLFKRHNSNDQDIRDLACAESQLPCGIAVTFEHANRVYKVRKSFLRSANSSLCENGREIARGREADEAVWELFGIGPGSGRTLDDGAFGVLWVGQGKSVAAPTISGRADFVLTAAIEAEVGSMVGGERARAVLSELSSQIAGFLTNTGRIKSDGPLGVVERNLARLREEEAELSARLATLDAHFTELTLLKAERARISDPAATHAAEAELGETERLFNEGREAVTILKGHENQERTAHAKLETATQRLAQLKETISRIDGARARETELVLEIEPLIMREQTARDVVAATKAQVAEIESELDRLDRRTQLLQQLAAAVTKAKIRHELAQKLASLESAASRLVRINAELYQIKVTAALLKNIENVERQQATLAAQLAAAAPQLIVEVQQQGAGLVRVGEELVAERFTGPVLQSTKIDIADVAMITVTPALADAKDHETKRRNLDEDLKKALRKAGVDSSVDAAASLARRLDLEAQQQGVRAELKVLGVGEDDSTTMIADLMQQIVSTDVAVQAALNQAGLGELPDASALEAEQSTARSQREEWQRQRAKLTGTRDVQDEGLEDAVAKRSGAQAEVAQLRRSLQADLNVCPDADRVTRLTELSKAVDNAQVVHERAAGALAARRSATPDQTELDRLENRCRRLREQADNRKTRLLELEGEIGRLEGQILNAGGDGIGEGLASTQGLREISEREAARLTSKIDALQLLHKTVSECLAEGQERYYAPVRRHLRPFLNDLFPGAELQLGQGYGIEGLKRTSDQSEPFERLSHGTQEQIAVLVRLAMGAMLAERGQAVPIFLDDALVYSDDDRITRMFDALSRAGQHQQVIVLTCRMRAFEQLGGRSIRIEVAPDAPREVET